MRSHRLILVLLLLAPAACAREGTGAAGPSWFRASLAGEVNKQYEGTGKFSFDRDHGDSPRYFKIYSHAVDAEVEQNFFVRWPSDRRPAVGTYPLVQHTDQYGSSQGATAIYLWTTGDNVSTPSGGELYVATGGEVEITRSTADELEGRITFSGLQVTKQGPLYRERDDPRHQPDAGAPKIAVAGTFRVTRYDEERLVVTNY